MRKSSRINGGLLTERYIDHVTVINDDRVADHALKNLRQIVGRTSSVHLIRADLRKKTLMSNSRCERINHPTHPDSAARCVVPPRARDITWQDFGRPAFSANDGTLSVSLTHTRAHSPSISLCSSANCKRGVSFWVWTRRARFMRHMTHDLFVTQAVSTVT